jgi:hypothetical protein
MRRITCQWGQSFASHSLDGHPREARPLCGRQVLHADIAAELADDDLIVATLVSTQDEYPYSPMQNVQPATSVQPMVVSSPEQVYVPVFSNAAQPRHLSSPNASTASRSTTTRLAIRLFLTCAVVIIAAFKTHVSIRDPFLRADFGEKIPYIIAFAIAGAIGVFVAAHLQRRRYGAR